MLALIQYTQMYKTTNVHNEVIRRICMHCGFFFLMKCAILPLCVPVTKTLMYMNVYCIWKSVCT